MQFHKLPASLKSAYRGSDVRGRVNRFENWMDVADRGGVRQEVYDHAQTVQEYYDLCNEFMVYGWSDSLHFAPLAPQESLDESIARHQRLMIDKLDLDAGMSVIDVGCGIGGPLRHVVREAGVRVAAVNNSPVQLDRARSLTVAAGLDHMVEFLPCNFMDMGVIGDSTLDRAYAIESTCHAPDKAGAFAEIYRVLKPGALFWGQEMCMTERFDPGNDRHQSVKRGLMQNIALRDIATFGEVNEALESSGFEILEAMDHAVGSEGPSTPWYAPMESRGGPLGSAMRNFPGGRAALLGVSRLAELAGFFPKGSADVVAVLDRAAVAYVAGGRAGIFTPLYCFLARKPG